jgi:cytochrome c-type biogenesis protein CcmF
MVIHPPMLYMGYVGFSVAFAFSIAALLAGKLDATWARWSRPWTLAAWSFLTHRHRARQLVGVLRAGLGRLVVLGPGRERVVHAVARRHGARAFARRDREARHVQELDVLLAIVAFSLSLLGTFLVRSGVLTSVHAFATDPTRGVFILIFLAVVVGGSLTLYAFRARIGRRGRSGSRRVARIAAARQQHPARRRVRERPARNAVSARHRRARPRQDLGRARPTSTPCSSR